MARACSAFSCVSRSKSHGGGPCSTWLRQSLRATRARSSSSVRKLCAGVPSSAWRVALKWLWFRRPFEVRQVQSFLWALGRREQSTIRALRSSRGMQLVGNQECKCENLLYPPYLPGSAPSPSATWPAFSGAGSTDCLTPPRPPLAPSGSKLGYRVDGGRVGVPAPDEAAAGEKVESFGRSPEMLQNGMLQIGGHPPTVRVAR